MKNKNRWILGFTATLAGAAIALGGALPASADPASGTNPVIDGFGSDTTQYVLNAISTVVKDSSGNAVIASYDAGTGLITPGSGEASPVPSIPRANGSGQGKTLLQAAINGTTPTLNGFTATGALGRDDVEFSRSSSTGTWTTTGQLNYVPFAIDGVTYARSNTTVGSIIPANLPIGSAGNTTELSLRNIYAGNVTTYTTGGTTYTLTPLLPQEGSGTRAFWLSALGLTEAQVGSNVSDVDANGDSVQENDGNHLLRNTDLVPFSIASYIAQGNSTTINANYTGVTVANVQNGAQLGFIGGTNPLSSGALNTSFPVLRPVFNVVEHNAIEPGQSVYNATLDGLFDSEIVNVNGVPTLDGSGNVQYTSKGTILDAKRPGSTTISVISDFGFAEIPANGWTNGGTTYYPGDQFHRSN